MKEKLFSVTKDDLEWSYFSVSGSGGQGRDRSSSGARCYHAPSGASGRATESRSQLTNRRMAMKRMSNTPAFKYWIEQQVRNTKTDEQLEKEVDEMLQNDPIRTEVLGPRGWKEVDSIS